MNPPPNPIKFWDIRYQNEEYAYGTEPNYYFKQQLDSIEKPGKILLLAEGEGRNAAYAAEKGWEVTAVDFSSEARKKALSLAEKRGVSIDYHVCPVQLFEFDRFGPWNAIGLVFAHFAPTLRAEIHRQSVLNLRKNGVLILEAFNKKQIARREHSGGPADKDMLYSKSMLREDFDGLEIIELTEQLYLLKEGKFHVGLAELIRCTAKRV